MAKRAFIIHGWGGNPNEGWFPWLKKELEARHFEVAVPSMPNPEEPKIEAWVSKLRQVAGEVDAETYLIGHSIGCQTILRYLETLPGDKKAAGVVLVAPWVTLSDEAYEVPEDREIGKPWIETPIDWQKVRSKSLKFTAIFCKDDPLVPFAENMSTFRDNLGAEIVVEEGKGHFSGSDGVKELPEVRRQIF